MNAFLLFLVTIFFSLSAFGVIYFFAPRWLAANQSRRVPFAPLALSPRAWDRLFLLSVSLYVLVFSALSILRYLSFNAGSDLGLYDQLVWNSLRGRLFQNSILQDAPFYLGKSFSPILLAFVPLYAVWRDPSVLLFTQTLALGAGAFPIYWFARERLGHPLALVMGWAFFLSPAVESINLIDVHGIAFALSTLAFATYFLMRQNDRAFLVCLGLALLIREEVALIVIMFGVYLFLFQRRRTFGLALFFFGCALTIVLLTFVIPFFRGPDYGPEFYYFGSGVTGQAGTRYTYLGHSIPEIIKTIVTQPEIVLQHVLTQEKIEFVLHLLIPLAFLPVLGLQVTLLTLPTLSYSLLSEFSFQYSIHSFYPAPMIPFLFFGAILGARRLLDARRAHGEPENPLDRTTRKLALGGALLTASLLSHYFVSPGPLAQNFQPDLFMLDQHAAIADRMIAQIPADATVAAQTEIVAHLSARQFIYEFPGFPDYRQMDYVVADTTQSWYDLHQSTWDEIRETGYFEVIAQEDGIVIAQRRMIAQPLEIHFTDQATLIGVTITPAAPLRGGMTLRPIVYWRAEKNIAERYWVRVRVEDAQGHIWAEEAREPQEGHLPTNRWQAGKIITDQFTLPLPPTMPGGDYKIILAVSPAERADFLPASDAQGKIIGGETIIATAPIPKNKSSFTASLLPIEEPLLIDMQELRLLGYTLPQRNLRPGEMLHLGIYWRARAKPLGDYTVAVQLRDQTGRVVSEQSARPANDAYSTNLWDAGEVLLDWHDFNLPKDILPGDYRIHVVLRDPSRGIILGEADLAMISIMR